MVQNLPHNLDILYQSNLFAEMQIIDRRERTVWCSTHAESMPSEALTTYWTPEWSEEERKDAADTIAFLLQRESCLTEDQIAIIKKMNTQEYLRRNSRFKRRARILIESEFFLLRAGIRRKSASAFVCLQNYYESTSGEGAKRLAYQRKEKTRAAIYSRQCWSGQRESNPPPQLGKLIFYQ